MKFQTDKHMTGAMEFISVTVAHLIVAAAAHSKLTAKQ